MDHSMSHHGPLLAHPSSLANVVSAWSGNSLGPFMAGLDSYLLCSFWPHGVLLFLCVGMTSWLPSSTTECSVLESFSPSREQRCQSLVSSASGGLLHRRCSSSSSRNRPHLHSATLFSYSSTLPSQSPTQPLWYAPIYHVLFRTFP